MQTKTIDSTQNKRLKGHAQLHPNCFKCFSSPLFVNDCLQSEKKEKHFQLLCYSYRHVSVSKAATQAELRWPSNDLLLFWSLILLTYCNSMAPAQEAK